MTSDKKATNVETEFAAEGLEMQSEKTMPVPSFEEGVEELLRQISETARSLSQRKLLAGAVVMFGVYPDPNDTPESEPGIARLGIDALTLTTPLTHLPLMICIAMTAQQMMERAASGQPDKTALN